MYGNYSAIKALPSLLEVWRYKTTQRSVLYFQKLSSPSASGARKGKWAGTSNHHPHELKMGGYPIGRRDNLQQKITWSPLMHPSPFEQPV